ncbi:14795_t:CDS:2 [Gigaspora rosea]|nr:14795_t:CDS:2 [Gigaspora rosea]
MGLMAKICKFLLEERYQAKENIENYELIDKAKYLYYISLSDVLKVVLNSICGGTGYKYSPFYLKPVSSFVTASARNNIIEFAKEKENSLKERILQIIAKYIDDENLSVDLFKLTAKYDPTTNQRVKKYDYWNFEKRKELDDETKKRNKMVISYVTKMADDHKITIEHANKKEKDLRIDIIYYFKSLQNICASLLRCDEKKAKVIINQIFEENELKKLHKITDFYFEEHKQQKTTLILKDIQQKTTPKEGVLYCKLLDNYWHNNNLLLIHKHVNDIAELGKRVCEKCNKHKFCCINAIVNNNCNIELCISINVTDHPININHMGFGYFPFQLTYTHQHTLCEDCFEACPKTTRLTFYNDSTWRRT